MGDERSLTFLESSFGSTKRNSISKDSLDFFLSGVTPLAR